MPRRPPTGFGPISHKSPFRQLCGPLYERITPDGVALGVYVANKHGNLSAVVHGGMLAMLADSALGLAISAAAPHIRKMVTTSLSIDYFGNAEVGEWIEARAAPHRIGRRMAFASCQIFRVEQPIVRASGAFLILEASAQRSR